MTIVEHAPGKLFIAGEYAVVTPGEPAVLVAIDRGVTATLVPRDDARGLVSSAQIDAPPLAWELSGGTPVATPVDHPYGYVWAALRMVERLRAETGGAPRGYELRIDSTLDDAAGAKYGLGSSGAVAVATVRAVARLHGLSLADDAVAKVALLATLEHAPAASGGDIAASTFGGWILYRSPDRAALSADIDRQTVGQLLDHVGWETGQITPLPAPAHQRLVIGWTGAPASTPHLVAQVGVSAGAEGFLARSRACVGELADALVAGVPDTASAAIRRARRLFQALGEASGQVLETTELAVLCDVAESFGAAAKPSGAGGGDCGIALVDDTVDLAALHSAWERGGIRPLDLAVVPSTQSTSSRRKDDHVRLATAQARRVAPSSPWDDIAFVHHALDGIDSDAVSLETDVAGRRWRLPFYINAMTGGSARTGDINRELAIVARETGVAIASGSMSAALDDDGVADTFRVLRDENPDGIVIANVGVERSPDDARRAVDLLRADALQVHLNAAQESVMPEGKRAFSFWSGSLERIVAASSVPVIVKEVGAGLSAKTLRRLHGMGVACADVSGVGGTDFVGVENARRRAQDFAYLVGWGQSAAACLLDAPASSPALLASGGVRTPLDVVRALALGADAVGVSGRFLSVLVADGRDGLQTLVATWRDHLIVLLALLGASDPRALRRSDLVVSGATADFCTARGIDITPLSHRSWSPHEERP